MCGITGKVRWRGASVTADDIARMNRALVHRGPDDTGVYLSPDRRVGLGSQRLAVLDLSAAGHQPLKYADRYVIVFNGEIYNFRELREELARAGVRFRSQTDTEVITALYQRDGPACVQRLRGMFAFAIYDEQAQTLFCARDRVGKKPFKYFFDGSVFLFASELKALLTQEECPRAPDWGAVHAYLTLQYVPAPRTGFAGIEKLEPGHTLFVDVGNGRVERRPYWSLRWTPKQTYARPEWRARVRQKIDEAVRLRLLADVPVGAFLSGGVDSSVIVACMARASARPVRTFSVGFPDARYSELPYARLVADRYRTDHTEFVVEPRAVTELPALVRQFEEPFGDSSALPTLLLCRRARPHVTVALTGDGGDENFGGYPRYTVHALAAALDRQQLLKRLLTAHVVSDLARALPGTVGFRAARFLASIRQPPPERHAAYIGYFTDAEQAALAAPAFAAAVREAPAFESVARAFRAGGREDPVEQAMAADIQTYLPDDLLVKMDLASMAASLEARSPLLDHELLELTASMPRALKVRGMRRKLIFKEAVGDLVPSAILTRAKRGFALPLDLWFRGELHGMLTETLLSDAARRRDLFRPAAVQALIERHVRGGANLGKFLWLLLTLELWFQQYLD